MAATAEKIQHLKLMIGAVDVTLPRESWSAPGLTEGIPKGAVVEILGPQKFEWFIAFLCAHPELDVFWAERAPGVLPTALYQRGVDLGRVTFGILGDDCFVSLRKILQSQVFPVVLAPAGFSELRQLQSFQLLTEKNHNTLFLAAEPGAVASAAASGPSPAWPIALQLDIHGAPHAGMPGEIHLSEERFQIEVLRRRYRRSE